MSEPYEETLEGETTLRLPPGTRHELICARLHAALKASVADFAGARLCEIRAPIELGGGTVLRPDLSLVTTATGKLWLAVEVVSSDDHRVDTVLKKEIYETARVSRLWMVDPRYDNIEIYRASEFGLVLKGILASREVLTESLLPEFQLTVAELFRAEAAPAG
jgi:Uma2 family endonuclease